MIDAGGPAGQPAAHKEDVLSPKADCQLNVRERLQARLANWYEVSSSAERISSMEGLRGVAVLLVFFVHFHALFGHYVARSSLSFLSSRFLAISGHGGVDLFFLISGYLIYGAVLDKRIQYRRFLRRRVQRIYPTFLVVLALYLILSVLFPSKSKIPDTWPEALLYVLANLFLLPGLLPIDPIMAVAWTLSYEFCFYLTVPVFVAVTGLARWSKRKRVGFLICCTSVFLVASMAPYVGHARFSLFLVGTLVYEAARSESFRQRLSATGEYATVALFVLACGAIYIMALNADLGIVLRSGIRVLILCISLFLFAMYSIAFGGFLRRSFSWTPIRWLGNMSYSYYLLHSLTLQAIALALSKLISQDHSTGLFWAMMPFSFCLTLVSSTLLFISIEKPFSLQPRKRVGTAPSSEPPAVASLAQRRQ